MKKQVLEARLRDVYIRKFDRAAGGEIRDFGNERTAAIGVKIRVVFSVSICVNTNFPNACQRFQSLK
jgi:hypothetical protein